VCGSTMTSDWAERPKKPTQKDRDS